MNITDIKYCFMPDYTKEEEALYNTLCQQFNIPFIIISVICLIIIIYFALKWDKKQKELMKK